jgi:voltage-gated potassium channel Kch
MLVVAVPDPLTMRQVVEHARATHPKLDIVARVHDPDERARLGRMPHTDGVWGEFELGLEMTRHVLRKCGVSPIETQAVVMDLRASDGQGSSGRGSRVTEFELAPTAAASGRRIADLELGKGTLIVTIQRAGEFVVPHGQTQLQAGDRLLVVADEAGIQRIASAVSQPAAPD